MSNLLSTAKKLLKEQAIDLYDCYSNDLPLEKEEFFNHYANLGKLIFEIESPEKFSQLLTKMENNEFDILGYHNSDDDMVGEFLDEVRKAQ